MRQLKCFCVACFFLFCGNGVAGSMDAVVSLLKIGKEKQIFSVSSRPGELEESRLILQSSLEYLRISDWKILSKEGGEGRKLLRFSTLRKAEKSWKQLLTYVHPDSMTVVKMTSFQAIGEELSGNFFLDHQKDNPTLKYCTSKEGCGSREFFYESMMEEDYLFYLSRRMVSTNTRELQVHIFGGIVAPGFLPRVSWVRLKVLDQFFKIQDVGTVLVSAEREDGKKAEFWVAREGSFRVLQAHDFQGLWYTHLKTTRSSVP